MNDPDDVALYEDLAPALIRFATGLVGPSDAEDVFSTAVVHAMTSPGWRSSTRKRSFLYTAVLNEARMFHRSRSRRRARETRAHVAVSIVQPEVHPEVPAALDRLSPRQRAVVVLTYWDDLTPAGVAARIGISEGAVRRHLARARRTLRRLLDEH